MKLFSFFPKYIDNDIMANCIIAVGYYITLLQNIIQKFTLPLPLSKWNSPYKKNRKMFNIIYAMIIVAKYISP